MSKETALVTPFLLAAFIYIYGNKKMFWRNSVPFFAAALIYIILRKTVLDFSSGALTVSMPLLERVLVIFDSLGKYFIKLVYPADLHMQYALILPGPVDISVILGIFLTLVMAWGAIAARKTERIVTFAIAWFFITYLPVSNVFPLNATFAEHWFYVPSMGIFMIAGWFLGKLCAGNKILKWSLSLFFVIVLGVFSYLTILQNNYWKDAEKFYKRTLEYARGAGRARIYFSLSIVYFEKGLTDEGIWALERAIKDKPDYVDARNNLATAFIMKGEYDKAIEQAEMSLGINPSSATAYYRLSVAYFHKKNYILARQSLEKAKRLGYRRVRPGYERALERLK